MTRLILLVLSAQICLAEIPFRVQLQNHLLKLIPTESSQGKLIIDFYRGNQKLSSGSRSYFMPTSEILTINLPDNSAANPNSLSAVATLLNINYELIESRTMFGSGPGQFRDGISISSDSFNQLYVIDAAQDKVLKFNQKLQFLNQFGSFNVDNSRSFEKDFGNIEEGQFDGVRNVLTGPKLTTFVSDSRNDRIVEVDGSGNFVREFSPRDGFDEPTRLQSNSRNEILVLDSENDRIVVFNSFGSQIFSIGGYGAGLHRFTRLNDFIVDSEDHLICLDQLTNHVLIKKYLRNGKLLKQQLIKGQYHRIEKDALDYLFLIGESGVTIFDTELRQKPQIFNQPDMLKDIVSLTSLKSQTLFSLHNNPSQIRVWTARNRILQSRINIPASPLTSKTN